MADYDFDMDIEAEIAGMRGGKSKSQTQRRPIQRPADKQVEKPVLGTGASSAANTGQAASSKPSQAEPPPQKPNPRDAPVSAPPVQEVLPERPEPEGRTAKHIQEEYGGSGSSSKTAKPHSSINWKQFKTIPGMFEHVGGDRPVGLVQDIQKTTVSGLPKPMIEHIQSELLAKHTNKIIEFPWGAFEILSTNKVFNSNASFARYLMFDALRDSAGTHVQYALQYMILNQMPLTALDSTFRPKKHLKPNDDELDIYALVYVAYLAEFGESGSQQSGVDSEKMLDAFDSIEKLHVNLGHVMQKLNEQDDEFSAYSERNHAIQTVLLLDRMGLLKGGLPRDTGEFKGILEQSRDAIQGTGEMIDGHIKAEKERLERIKRDELFKRRR